MKPIRIYRHISCDEPGYLGAFFQQRQVEYEVVCSGNGAPAPMDLEGVSGLVFMGAAVSIHDGYPWIQQEIDLIRNAVARGVPVMGICFGAQLMSLALGGKVTHGPQMTIGWHPVQVAQNRIASDWWSPLPEEATVFHWHLDTFSIPAGAAPIASGGCVENQAFALGDHLAMQFHVEMTPEMVATWVRKYGSDLESSSSCIHSEQQLLSRIDDRVEALGRVADQLYGRWLERVTGRPSGPADRGRGCSG